MSGEETLKCCSFSCRRNFPEAFNVVCRARGTDPHLSPVPDACDTEKRNLRFLQELHFCARVHSALARDYRTAAWCISPGQIFFGGGEMLSPTDSVHMSTNPRQRLSVSQARRFLYASHSPPCPRVPAMTEEHTLSIPMKRVPR